MGKVTKYNTADRYDVLDNLPQLSEYFQLIKKEFDCYYYKDFIEGHCSVIMQIRDAHKANKVESIQYVKEVRKYKPSIAIYTGSFNPFHVGHYDIVMESEKVFDKVIVAKGHNPEKSNSGILEGINTWNDVPSALLCKETVTYSGTIFNLYEHYSKLYDTITFIKGFRSGHDIEYDLHQYRVIKDINPKINFVFLPCTQGKEHVSSSMIRNLEKLKLPTDIYAVK